MFIRDIYDAIYPISLTTAAFGLSSIFVKTQNGKRKLKTFNILKIINVLHVTIFSYMIYDTMQDFRNQNLHVHYATGVSKIGIMFEIIGQITLTYVIYVVNITNSPSILSCIEEIKRNDEDFQNLGEDLNYYKHCVYETILIAAGFTSLLLRSIVTHIYLSKSIFTNNATPHIIVSFPSLISYIAQNHFVFLVKLLNERFSLINRILSNLSETKIMKLTVTKVKTQEQEIKHNIRKIEMLMELHDNLTDIGNKLNGSFSIQILTCFTSQFLTEVFTIFYLYYESLILKSKISALAWSLWTIGTTLEIFHVTITCHLTWKESKKTGMVIHKVLMTENDHYMKKKLMIFSQQVSHKPLQFTACGLFPIDTTLIFTITGAAATYLLIMLQFQEGIEAQCSNVTLH